MAAPTPALASISSLRSDLEAPPIIRLDEDLEDRPPADDRERLGALALMTLALLMGRSLKVSISTGSAHDIGGESYRCYRCCCGDGVSEVFGSSRHTAV